MDDASAILSDHVFDNSHYMIVTRVNEHWFAHDFAKPVGRGKLGLKSCSVNSAEAKWVDP